MWYVSPAIPHAAQWLIIQFVLLSRPMTRLPRIMLQLTTALQYTPTDHPDQEGIPALTDSLSRIIKGSQVSHAALIRREMDGGWEGRILTKH